MGEAPPSSSRSGRGYFIMRLPYNHLRLPQRLTVYGRTIENHTLPPSATEFDCDPDIRVDYCLVAKSGKHIEHQTIQHAGGVKPPQVIDPAVMRWTSRSILPTDPIWLRECPFPKSVDHTGAPIIGPRGAEVLAHDGSTTVRFLVLSRAGEGIGEPTPLRGSKIIKLRESTTRDAKKRLRARLNYWRRIGVAPTPPWYKRWLGQ